MNTHLRALPGAAERLALCKADLLDYDVLRAGCHGVFHTASSVTDDPPICCMEYEPTEVTSNHFRGFLFRKDMDEDMIYS
ncbi:hypothetical protein BDA96_01G332700 [Sorghum bicolor]|uniref:3-beta hydroxysteroid dehydrogenase/isomerase domain-containing protein n=2 Tax=Sorghum bicolor TaxID=4558 RepID=A0A921V253_SORBI|nr:hypothetical protein BDA96_01G332700 [Sorghum bicolor]OQU92207.1 hypothetical protein SORBI_3001G310166 [Sorghum bicolor]